MKLIDTLTTVPLFTECLYDETVLATCTSFLFLKGGQDFLITNWHCVTGLDARTLDCLHSQGGTPNRLRVWHHKEGHLGDWVAVEESLFDEDGLPRWIEITSPFVIDVVAIPILRRPNCSYAPLPQQTIGVDLVIFNSEPVSVIGFPLRQTAYGRFPIWKTGHVASDIIIDYAGLPVFLIDAATRPSMSGSPVIARRVGNFFTSQGVTLSTSIAERFLGIYSGCTAEGSDVGMVWKSEVVDLLMEKGAC